MGVPARFIWHKETDLSGIDLLVIPGGFTYGDYLRTGAIARVSPVMEAVSRFVKQGRPVIGICNGFQILLEARLLPGAMLYNKNLRFVSKETWIRVENDRSIFTRGLRQGDLLRMPVAHGEGNYFIEPDGLKRLQDNDQILFRYCDHQGKITPESNFNGSLDSIAGICSEKGNVLGMMPHPERAVESLVGSEDGRKIFESVLNTLSAA